MSCILCGRDLHKQCAINLRTGTCCGSTSLCNKINNSDPSKGTGEAGTARSRTARHREGGTGSEQEYNDSATDLEDDLEPSYTKEYKDAESTGRKQAAILYPLDRESDCEWRGLSNCGGGNPIVGCIDGKQSNRHHGPDKNTLNNSRGNVHRICARCHNLWHEWNDADPHPEKRHDPVAADPAELVLWSKKETRPKAPVSRYHWHREREGLND